MKSSQLLQRVEGHAAAFAKWTMQRVSNRTMLVILAVIVGLLAGLGASLLKSAVGSLTKVFTNGNIPAAHWWLIPLPIIGVLLTVCFSRYIIHDNLEHGCAQIDRDLKNQNYRLRRHLCFSPIVACTLTLGLGGSAGSEGPIAYTGAGLGSNLGKFFGLPDDMLRILIGCGAGAGIAGIFKSPIGGTLFTLEVLKMPLTTVPILALVISCLAASTMAYLYSGLALDISFEPLSNFPVELTPVVIILGLGCGLYSLYYSFFMEKVDALFARIKNHWVKNVISGVLIGCLVFTFPALYGEGYNIIGELINGANPHMLSGSIFEHLASPTTIIFYLIGVLAVKSIVTAATNSGGGVGGDFAPTLFAGALAGALFGLLCKAIIGEAAEIPAGLFAVFGMAGVMAGAIQAPLMAIFLVAEMIGDFGLLVPITVAAFVSYFTVRILSRRYHIHFHPSWLHGNISHFFNKL